MGRIIVVAVCCLAACGRSGYERRALFDGGDDDLGDSGGDGDADGGPELLVEAIVPGASTAWNSYMRFLGASPELPFEACVEAGRYRDCVHTGELRRVAVPGASACAGLAITASQPFFEWQCAESAAGPVFTTTRLAPGIGLRDLVDFATGAFKPLSVSVTEPGQAPRVSAETVWWSNPVRLLPGVGADGRVLLDEEETVYLMPTSVAAHGIDLRAHGVAVVAAPQARLLPAQGTPPATCQSIAVGTHAASPAACRVHAANVDRVWIELDTGGQSEGSAIALALDEARWARVHRSRFVPANGHGLQLRDTRASRLTDVTIERGDGSVVFESSGNLFSSLRLAGGDVYLAASNENVFDALTTFGGFAGINLNGSASNNAFVGALSFSHAAHGVQIAGSNNVANVFVGTTVAGSTLAGVGVWGSDRATFHLSAIVNSGEHGIDFTGRATTVSHLVSGANSFTGVEIQDAAEWQRFAGTLTLVSNGFAPCDVGAATIGPALTEPFCAPANLSDTQILVRLLTQDLSTAFVGFVADDPANSSDTPGAPTGVPVANTAFDFAGASNRYSGWLASATDPVLDGNNRNCPGNNGSCWAFAGASMRLVDWSLVANDNALFDSTLAQPKAPFVPGGPCPEGLDGNAYLTDLRDGELLFDGVGDDDGLCEATETCLGNKYLKAAIEVIDDYVGDDDGLCESDEQCVYAPNYGAYQGHGDFRLSRCTFANGAIANVVMFAHPENGYPATP